MVRRMVLVNGIVLIIEEEVAIFIFWKVKRIPEKCL
jgi:hypothetical protein